MRVVGACVVEKKMGALSACVRVVSVLARGGGSTLSLTTRFCFRIAACVRNSLDSHRTIFLSLVVRPIRSVRRRRRRRRARARRPTTTDRRPTTTPPPPPPAHRPPPPARIIILFVFVFSPAHSVPRVRAWSVAVGL